MGLKWTPSHRLILEVGEDPLLTAALRPCPPPPLRESHVAQAPPLLAEFRELRAWLAATDARRSGARLESNSAGAPGHTQATPWENPSCTWSHQSSSVGSSTPSSSSAAAPPFAHS